MPDENGNYTAEEVAVLKADSAKVLEASKVAQATAEAQVGEFNAKEELASLATEFPKINDVSILVGSTMEDKRKMGEAISKMIPDPKKELTDEEKATAEKVKAEADKKAAETAYNTGKGADFKDAGDHGGGSGEGSDGGKEAIMASIEAHQKAGNHMGVLTDLIKGQPEAMKYHWEKST